MRTLACLILLTALLIASGCVSAPPSPSGSTVPLVGSPSQPLTPDTTATGLPTTVSTVADTPRAVGSCPAGQSECSGVCVDLQTDWYHCGSCDYPCGAGQTCSSGICTGSTAPPCPEGQSSCSGTCTDIRYDPNNCGSCGSACPSGQGCVDSACTGGSSGPSCPATQLMCSGICVNYLTDKTNCGSCGHTCFTGSTCTAGSCQCPSGETACLKPVTPSPFGRALKPAPTCENLNTDHDNCGACNNVCGVKETCCNGHCANLNIDPFNCGTCKKRCPGPLDPMTKRYCRLGQCSATPP